MNTPEANRARVELFREQEKQKAEWIRYCVQHGLNPWDGSATDHDSSWQCIVGLVLATEQENRKRDKIPHTSRARGSVIHAPRAHRRPWS